MRAAPPHRDFQCVTASSCRRRPALIWAIAALLTDNDETDRVARRHTEFFVAIVLGPERVSVDVAARAACGVAVQAVVFLLIYYNY